MEMFIFHTSLPIPKPLVNATEEQMRTRATAVVPHQLLVIAYLVEGTVTTETRLTLVCNVLVSSPEVCMCAPFSDWAGLKYILLVCIPFSTVPSCTVCT